MAEPGLTMSQRPPSGWAIRQKLERLRQCDPGCGGGQQRTLTKLMSRTPPKLMRGPLRLRRLLTGMSSPAGLEGNPPVVTESETSSSADSRDSGTSNTDFVTDFCEFLDARRYMSNKITQHGADRNVKGSPHQTSSPNSCLRFRCQLLACCLLAVCIKVLWCSFCRCLLCYSTSFSSGNSTRRSETSFLYFSRLCWANLALQLRVPSSGHAARESFCMNP